MAAQRYRFLSLLVGTGKPWTTYRVIMSFRNTWTGTCFVKGAVKKRGLKFGLLNAGSLGTRHDELIAAMERHDVDVMAINETWLRQGEEGRAPAVPNYRLRHVPRPASVRSRGGGVGAYIRRGVTARVLPHPATDNVEQMWLCMTVNAKKIVIGIAYRPPWLNVDVFMTALSASMEAFAWCDNVIILGDFNINMLNPNESAKYKIEEFMACHSNVSKSPHILQPTVRL